MKNEHVEQKWTFGPPENYFCQHVFPSIIQTKNTDTTDPEQKANADLPKFEGLAGGLSIPSTDPSGMVLQQVLPFNRIPIKDRLRSSVSQFSLLLFDIKDESNKQIKCFS